MPDPLVVLSFTEDSQLLIEFGEDRNTTMQLTAEEVDLVEGVLADPNFWANFLSALSGALTMHR